MVLRESLDEEYIAVVVWEIIIINKLMFHLTYMHVIQW